MPGFQSYFKARMWLLRRGWRLIVAGYYPVEFADFWLADQLNSLAAVILDLEYMSCFFRIDGGLNGPKEGKRYAFHGVRLISLELKSRKGVFCWNFSKISYESFRLPTKNFF